jgi:hypothetical protein
MKRRDKSLAIANQDLDGVGVHNGFSGCPWRRKSGQARTVYFKRFQKLVSNRRKILEAGYEA